jgi:hypothetical protein
MAGRTAAALRSGWPSTKWISDKRVSSLPGGRGVREILVEALSPEMAIGGAADPLGGYSDPVARLSDAAPKDLSNLRLTG